MAIIDLIFPNSCLTCHSIDIDSTSHFCHDCWKSLTYIQNPYCTICGIPFSFTETGVRSQDLLCKECHKKKPAYDKARCIFIYNDTIKKSILMLKNNDQTQYAKAFANLMTHYLSKEPFQIDIIIPIPLHWTRLLKRQFNQSGLISKHLSKTINISVDFDSLKRLKKTQSQGHQSRKNRFLNLHEAFEVEAPERIKDKNILLIDDVMTTGSTLHEAAKALKSADAKHVYCLSIARSVPGFE